MKSIRSDKNIYLLTRGSYSEYQVIGVYSTKKLAEEAQLLAPESRIEKYDLDYLPKHPERYNAWVVRINDDGVVKEGRAYLISPLINRVPNEYFSDKYDSVIYCWASDSEHAMKIALDKYYQYKAQSLGL